MPRVVDKLKDSDPSVSASAMIALGEISQQCK